MPCYERMKKLDYFSYFFRSVWESSYELFFMDYVVTTTTEYYFKNTKGPFGLNLLLLKLKTESIVAK